MEEDQKAQNRSSARWLAIAGGLITGLTGIFMAVYSVMAGEETGAGALLRRWPSDLSPGPSSGGLANRSRMTPWLAMAGSTQPCPLTKPPFALRPFPAPTRTRPARLPSTAARCWGNEGLILR